MESSNQVARTAPSLRELALELGATVKQFHLPWAGPLGPGPFVLATVDSLVFQSGHCPDCPTSRRRCPVESSHPSLFVVVLLVKLPLSSPFVQFQKYLPTPATSNCSGRSIPHGAPENNSHDHTFQWRPKIAKMFLPNIESMLPTQTSLQHVPYVQLQRKSQTLAPNPFPNPDHRFIGRTT